MNNKNKNFIAFTLSEMMIVLLIVSVISAATLPAITGKKTITPQQVNSKWQKDSAYDLGHYFIGSTGNTYAEVIIGQDTSSWTADQINTMRSNVGIAALHLQRPDAAEVLSGYGTQYASYGNSDIVFYDRENLYSGKIKADERGNIAIGEYAGVLTNKINTYGDLYIGHYAGFGNRSLTTNSHNTFIGTSGMISGNTSSNNSFGYHNNLSIGNDITQSRFNGNNVVVGNYAVTYAHISNSVIIGDYSSYGRNNNLDRAVNIGYYSGATIKYTAVVPTIGLPGEPGGGNTGPTYMVGGYPNQINLGYYSGYYSGATNYTISGQTGSGDYVFSTYLTHVINIGNYAGAYQYNGFGGGYPLKNNNSVSIGNYAGYAAWGYLNIGHYAGARSATNTEVNIGEYAGAHAVKISSRQNQNINIGRYAGYGFISSALSNAVNIGVYSGYLSQNTENAVNIGAYAGYKNSYNGANSVDNNYNINIGNYAGAARENLTSEKGNSIHIGDTGAYGTNYSNVIIGCWGHNIKAPYRMCIGGKYPSASTAMTNVFKPTNTSNTIYSSLFLPPGISAATNSQWPYTIIFLSAKHIIGFTSSFSTFSDRTLKENIKITTDGIKNVRKLNIVEFNIIGDKSPRVGVIAQELQNVYPNLVSKATFENGKEYYSVSYERFIYSLAQAVKDVDKMALDLQKEIKDNFELLTKLSEKILSVEKRLNNLANADQKLQAKLKEIDEIIIKAERK